MSSYRNAYHDNVRRDVFPYVPRPAGSVLDVGGGVGATAAALKSEGYCDKIGVIDLFAPDVKQSGVDFSYSASLEDPEVLQKIKRDQGRFDTILCLDVLEHLFDPWKIIRELEELLAEGGCIVASIPNVQHYSVVGPLLRGNWELKDAGILDRTHIRFFTRNGAIKLMTGSGMKLEFVTTLLRKKSRIGRLNMLTMGVFENFLTTQFLVRVRKQ